jgi:UDP-3-O-[3-hydroxymyristoyl] glucosamine N-acyltransferase
MRKFQKPLSPQAIQKLTGGELILKHEVELTSIADPQEAEQHSVVFLDNEKFLDLALQSDAGLIFVANRFRENFKDKPNNLIVVENPYQSVLILINYWLESEKGEFISSVHTTAVIGKNVTLPEHVFIGPYTVIGDNVKIGEYTRVESFCSIGSNTVIGQHCNLFPNVTLYEDTVIGNNVRLHSGVVIGADGFGYILMDGVQRKIPQIGNVIIHDHVEIGAGTTIDRGTIGPTVVGEDTKIDNLVQIGHNCVIGRHCIICAQAGLAGSSKLGDYVYLAGQVGLAGHLTIGDGAMVGAQSGVSNDLEAGKKYFGYPAREAMHMKRIMAVQGNLPEIYRMVQKLIKDKEQK